MPQPLTPYPPDARACAEAQLLRQTYLWGGLLVFSLFTLKDAATMVGRAIHNDEFDPLGESLELYLDTIDIFTRVATILAEDSERKHRRRTGGARLSSE